jgi:uncharacterized protein HemX
MSEQTKKSKTAKWNMAQVLGFWFLLTALIFGWGGAYLGGVANENGHRAIEQAKAEAIESMSKE